MFNSSGKMSESGKKLRAVFIVNPFSGVGRQKAIEKHLRQQLDHDAFDFEIIYTERQHHATRICENAISKGVELVVAVGGDGTINETAKHLVGKEIPLGIIPSGSGNGLAHHLKIPVEVTKAIKVLNQKHTKKIDTVEVNGQFFLSIAGVGFDAFVAKKMSREKKRGFFKYLLITVSEYLSYRPKKFTLIVDGKKVKRKALFISLANSDQFGNNASIAPHAKIDDGMIDICIMKKFPLWKSIILAPMLFTGKIDRSPYIEIFRAREVDIKQKNKRINLDGESVKLSHKLSIKVLPQSLTVIVP